MLVASQQPNIEPQYSKLRFQPYFFEIPMNKQPAVVNYAQEPMSVELREIDVPEIGPNDTLMQVAAVGVCGSDLHQWAGLHSWPVNYPVTLGHEFAGRIVKTGANVTAFREGDRVCSETAAIIDPNSPMTRIGKYNLDPNRKGFGYGTHGAMTRYVKVPERCLHKVPDNLPLRYAALTEPCCVAFSAVVANANIQPGDRIAVLGPGPIGLLCGALARMRGAEVAVVGLPQDQARLSIAKDLLGPPSATDWVAKVSSMQPGFRLHSRPRSTSYARLAGSAKSAGVAIQSVSRSIHWCKRTSRSKVASRTLGPSGNGFCCCLPTDRSMSPKSSADPGASNIGTTHSKPCIRARSPRQCWKSNPTWPLKQLATIEHRKQLLKAN
jgi:NADPH:quinone reductase-like Zn-dependent oxidoreductase